MEFTLSIAEQPSPDGLAQAFIIGEKFIGNDSACLVLGDNIFYGSGFTRLLTNAVKEAEEKKTTVFGYWVSDSERMRELVKPMLKKQYGQYLLRVIDEKKEEIDSDSFRNMF